MVWHGVAWHAPPLTGGRESESESEREREAKRQTAAAAATAECTHVEQGASQLVENGAAGEERLVPVHKHALWKGWGMRPLSPPARWCGNLHG